MLGAHLPLDLDHRDDMFSSADVSNMRLAETILLSYYPAFTLSGTVNMVVKGTLGEGRDTRHECMQHANDSKDNKECMKYSSLLQFAT